MTKAQGGLLIRHGIYYARYCRRGRTVRFSLKTRDPHVAAARLGIHLATVDEQERLDGAVERLCAGVELLGADVIALRRPVVYVWRRGDRVLYVGKGASGIGRPLSPAHHRLQKLLPDDTVRILWCRDAAEADTLEARLIEHWRPPLNRGTETELTEAEAATMADPEPSLEQIAAALLRVGQT